MADNPTSSSLGKWLAGIAGTVITAVLIWWLTNPGGLLSSAQTASTAPAQAPLPTEPPSPTNIPDPTQPPPTPIPQAEVPLPPVDTSTINQPAVLPADAGCPFDPTAGWLPFPDVWYGPYDGFYIGYDFFSFYVYDPYQLDAFFGTYGVTLPYPIQITPNSWTPLFGTTFWVCIDTPGNVYAAYAP